MEILLLIVGLTLILVGANYLTDGSSALAQRFGISEFIVGLTIVAIGTSTPEIVVSVLSSIDGKSSMAIGNVVGSNIFNIFVILGLCSLLRPIALTKSNIRRDVPLSVAASLLMWAVLSDSLFGGADSISRIDGGVMLTLYIALMVYTVRQGRTATNKDEITPPTTPLWLSVVMVVGGLAALIYGGEIFLNNATALARTMGISEGVIAITLVAGGTSLPELAASVVSLYKGKADMALGNVIGSCIANILLILGVSSLINPLSVGDITTLDIAMCALGSVLLFITAYTFKSRTIDRYEGAIFLLLYGAYMWYLFN